MSRHREIFYCIFVLLVIVFPSLGPMSAEGRPTTLLQYHTFHSTCSISLLDAPWAARWRRIFCIKLGTRLRLAGCLLLGAGFLIKLDATGPHGQFLTCNEGVLAAFGDPGVGRKLDTIAPGMLAANALGPVKRMPAPVMFQTGQYGQGTQQGGMGVWQILGTGRRVHDDQ